MINKSSQKKLQVCKQQQTASGNVRLLMLSVPITPFGYFAFYKMYIMQIFLWVLCLNNACECGKKGKEKKLCELKGVEYRDAIRSKETRQG